MYYTVNINGANLSPKFRWTRDYGKALDERRRLLRLAFIEQINLPCGIQVFGHEDKATVLKADVSNWNELGCVVVGIDR